MMTERQFTEQEILIARYRVLEREVTDPLAAHLLHDIVSELEADLRKDRETIRTGRSSGRQRTDD